MTRKRSSDRKQARVLGKTHPGLPGMSLRDKMIADLDTALYQYLLIKDSEGSDSGDARMARGIVRGIAIALAHVSIDVEYRPTARDIEREAMKRRKHAT